MTESKPKPRWRRRLIAVTVVLLGAVMGLAVLETGLRVSTPAWLGQRMQELNAGEPLENGSDGNWRAILEAGRFRQFEPYARFTVRHAEYRHGVTIDELGGRYTPPGADPSVLVPFVGDSFTFGLGVEDSETFISRIAPETPYRLLNLGVPGSGLRDHLDIVQMRHAELGRPALYVFVVFMGNDLDDVRARYERARGSARPEDGLAFRANLLVFNNPLLKRSYVIQYARQKLLALINRGGSGYMQPVFRAMRTDRPYLEDSMVYWRQELERLRTVAGTLGFRYLLVLIPDVHQLDDQRRAAKAESYGLADGRLDPGRVSRAFAGALDDLEVPYFDLEPCLSKSAPDGLFYVQDNHFTAAGHALAGRCILDSGLPEAIAATMRAAAAEGRPAAGMGIGR